MHKGLPIIHNLTLLIHFAFRFPLLRTLYLETKIICERQHVKITNGGNTCLTIQQALGGLAHELSAHSEASGWESTYSLQLLGRDGLQSLDGVGHLWRLAALDEVCASCKEAGIAHLT